MNIRKQVLAEYVKLLHEWYQNHKSQSPEWARNWEERFLAQMELCGTLGIDPNLLQMIARGIAGTYGEN